MERLLEDLSEWYLSLTDTDGNTVKIGLRLVPNESYHGFYYVVTDDEVGLIVGAVEHQMVYLLGDRVEVSGDCYGYICPGIHHPGMGRIAEVRADDTDHFYGIIMDDGEFGFMKSNRLQLA